jgi:hypothetical protein
LGIYLEVRSLVRPRKGGVACSHDWLRAGVEDAELEVTPVGYMLPLLRYQLVGGKGGYRIGRTQEPVH